MERDGAKSNKLADSVSSWAAAARRGAAIAQLFARAWIATFAGQLSRLRRPSNKWHGSMGARHQSAKNAGNLRLATASSA